MIGVTMPSRERAAAPAPRALMVLMPDRVSQKVLPHEGELLIGRGHDADVRLEHASVSRRHAVLKIGETMTIADLGSANGTRLARAHPGASAPVGKTTQVLAPRRTLRSGETAEIGVGDIIEIGAVMAIVQRAPAGASEDGEAPIVVSHATMQALHSISERVAAGDISVLLLGESGAGKEVFAQRIHSASRRAGKPLVTINCAELSSTLLESEIFGHERGAFTGAAQSKPGLFEVGDGGTVFLDEVGELPLDIQAKLLRVLEMREVRRLGGVKPRAIDVRFVSATNRDLRAEVAARRFRNDLYFRLNGVSLVIPPLRERTTEILELAEHFIGVHASPKNRPVLSEEARTALLQYSWPGNIRELRNVMELAVLMVPSGGQILPEHLRLEGLPAAEDAGGTVDADVPVEEGGAPLKAQLREMERARMIEALKASGGVQVRAARLIGMPLRTFKHKLKAYGIPRPAR
jgi:two-component system response regulator AtoC